MQGIFSPPSCKQKPGNVRNDKRRSQGVDSFQVKLGCHKLEGRRETPGKISVRRPFIVNFACVTMLLFLLLFLNLLLMHYCIIVLLYIIVIFHLCAVNTNIRE